MRKSKTHKEAKTKADKWFSRYIRLRDSDGNGYIRCCTTGARLHWKDAHCGHFQSRRYMATRYDEQNCAPQSPYANTYLAGMQYEFGKYIDWKYGAGTADQLVEKAKQSMKLSKTQLDEIADTYKTKANQIATQKNIDL